MAGRKRKVVRPRQLVQDDEQRSADNTEQQSETPTKKSREVSEEDTQAGATVTTVQESSESHVEIDNESQDDTQHPISRKVRAPHYPFSIEQEEAIIDWYEAHPILWDRNSQEFRLHKQADRDKLYEEKAKDYEGCTGEFKLNINKI